MTMKNVFLFRWTWSIKLGVILLLVALVTYTSLGPATAPHKQIFINAQVLTMDKNNSVAEAIALENNKIVAIGSSVEISKLITSRTQVNDLQGKTLIPGFIDAHGHFPGSGLFKVSADLRSPPMGGVTTMTELLEALKQEAFAKAPGEWVTGSGYDDTLIAERRHPTRQELDSVSLEHPIYITHTSGHMGVANSAALNDLGITSETSNPKGGVIVRDSVSGELTGLLEETAQKPATARALDFSISQIMTLFQFAIKEYAAAGITTAQSGGLDERSLKVIALASRLGFIPFRVELWPWYDDLAEDILSGSFVEADFESELAKIGAVKIVADGSIQGFTGYLAQPYHAPYKGDKDYRGYPVVAHKDLVLQLEKLHKARHRIAVHGNGDAAIDDILDAFAQAQAKYPMEDPRLVLIHSQMARKDQLLKMKTLGITPSFFTAHTYYWGDRHSKLFMGPERASRMSPTKTAQELDLRFSVHLDVPIAPMEPFTLLWSTVNRRSTAGNVIGSAERLSTLTALRAMTIDAAYQIFRDHEIGSIEVGKMADLLVLDKNPLTVDPMNLRSLKVERTIVNGVTIYEG